MNPSAVENVAKSVMASPVTVLHQGAVAGVGRRGLSDRLTLTRWRNAIFRVARATN